MTRPRGKPPSKARDFACPTCGAGVGELCWVTNPAGDLVQASGRYHAARYHLAGLKPPKSGHQRGHPERKRQDKRRR